LYSVYNEWTRNNLSIQINTKNISLVKKSRMGWMWWCMPIIQALGRLRQEDCKLEGSMNNIIRSSLEKKRKKQKERKMFCIVRHWGNVN
jgi:hypothetical protein